MTHDPHTCAGRIGEIRRLVAPLDPLRGFRNRERWDLWVVGPDGRERQFIATTPSMPARRGHQVVLALLDGAPVGILNQTTGARLNFLRADPPALYHPIDGIVPVVLLFLSVIVAMVMDSAVVFVFSVPLSVLYVPALMVLRAVRNVWRRAKADRILDRMSRGTLE
jgi:hypothetical protein